MMHEKKKTLLVQTQGERKNVKMKYRKWKMRVREWKAWDGNLISKFFLFLGLGSWVFLMNDEKTLGTNASLIQLIGRTKKASSRFHSHSTSSSVLIAISEFCSAGLICTKGSTIHFDSDHRWFIDDDETSMLKLPWKALESFNICRRFLSKLKLFSLWNVESYKWF